MSNKAQKRGLVPKLRFPEFRDTAGWVEKSVGDFGDVVTGSTPSTVRPEFYGGGFPFVSPADISDLRFVNETKTTLTALGFDETRPIKANSVLFVCIGSTIGKVTQNVQDCATNQQINSVIPNAEHSGSFVYYTLSVNAARIANLAGKHAVPIINKTQFSATRLPVPKLREQECIADCLASLDERITLVTQKLDTLMTHKKGLMQQLFPAEGETLPKLRFLEFRNAGEWAETTIGEIGSFYYGKSAPKWSLEEGAPTQCVRYGELYTKFGAVITEIFSRTNIDPSNLRFSKGGEILVPRVGEKPEDFGKCCCYLPLGDIAIGEMISVFETAQNPLFYTYYFRNLYRQFAKVVEGQNVKNLYYVELEPLAICRPPLPEQQKIADCLASLDVLITAQTQKLAALKIHKKGLMQQLFPVMDAKAEVEA